MKVPEIFDEIAESMRSELRKARLALSHPGQKGSALEDAFRSFLRNHLPAALDVSTGTLIDSTGTSSSRQLDVIIADAAATPVFYRAGEIRVVPIEPVYAVIEVKARLTKEELRRSFANMQSVRALKKKAYLKPTGPILQHSRLYGREWDIWPVNYFVFAYESTELLELAEQLEELHKEYKSEVWERIDTVCVLDRGVICNRNQEGFFNALPEPESHLYVGQTKRALLLFYTLLSHPLFQTRLPRLRFLDYLGQMTFE